MELDLYDFGDEPWRVGERARAAEAAGFGAMWFAEAAHNAYLPCAVAAATTTRLGVGTGIAVAFPRSPMVTAQIAWDLAAASQGRFVLGLGTQVKAHIERRFGLPYSHPGPRLREYVLAVRAALAAFEGAAPLRFEGEYYRLTLLPEFFTPGPLPPGTPPIPIYIAAVNAGLARLAGEVCDGVHVHPLHSVRYLREVVVPAIARGAEATGRRVGDVMLAIPLFLAVGDREEDVVRQRAHIRGQIAFYGSTRTYRRIFETHGWDDVPDRLHALMAERRGDEMAALITDDMLDAFAITSSWDRLAERIRERYAGLRCRVFPYVLPGGPVTDRRQQERWRAINEGVRL